MNTSNPLDCKYAGQCSGCAWIHKPYSEQLQEKLEILNHQLEPYSYSCEKIVSSGEGHLRDYLDLSYRNDNGQKALGLYDTDRSQILDLEECQQAKPELWQWILRFRENLPNVTKASFRFRLSPDAKVGIWMDMANVDIKSLLDEKTWLKSLMGFAHIEMGQKRKTLVEEEGSLKLKEGLFHPWFSTFIASDLQAYPLNMKVGGFSQSSRESNHLLIKAVQTFTQDIPKGFAIDLCCGIGNFTYALASWGWHVEGHDFDTDSLKAAQMSAVGFPLKPPEFIRTNIHAKNEDFVTKLTKAKLVLVDPPRSGLQSFVELIIKAKPQYLIYVSCYPKSYFEDLDKLYKAGYRIKNMTLVDQFSQSPHIEKVSLLQYGD